MPVQDLVTVDMVKAALPGVKLKQFNGTEFDDAFFAEAINTAVRLYEAKYGVVLSGYATTQARCKVDAKDWESRSWYLKALPLRPVLRIVTFQVQYGTFAPHSIPATWCVVKEPIHGRVQLVPGPGSIAHPYIAGGGGDAWFANDMLSMGAYIPNLFRYSYQAGFEQSIGTCTAVANTKTLAFPQDMNDMAAVTNCDGDMLKYNSVLKVGSSLYHVRDVDELLVTVQETVTEDGTQDVVWYKHDPLFLSAIRDYAALEAVNQANLTATKDPGMLSSALGFDGMNQSKSFPSKGPYANFIEALTKRLEKAELAIHRLYGEVNTLIE